MKLPVKKVAHMKLMVKKSVIDSPAQKKRWWWFRRSSAGKTGSTDSGRSAPLPYNRPSRQSGQESGGLDGSGRESGGWRARFGFVYMLYQHLYNYYR
ncbi:hypothetical protein CDAR_453681 [Caerostris darwini]|uniref:Uncharacterized protein n=1 Tax=Caerostris darwini TaxID=1538125 RepID=A0AAV4P2W6_9ARAC|nr:hypothetical protein CDAR_453681 [Caerostris darwini]